MKGLDDMKLTPIIDKQDKSVLFAYHKTNGHLLSLGKAGVFSFV
jgi:hypothetical protein